MDPHQLGQTTVVVASADSELLDHVLSATAVVGIEPLILSDPGLLREHWATASMLLLGVDQATRIVALGLPRRGDVYLVAGEQTSAAQAQQCSIRLGAAVLSLPTSAGWLSEALADISGRGPGTGNLVCVVGDDPGLLVGHATFAQRGSQGGQLVEPALERYATPDLHAE